MVDGYLAADDDLTPTLVLDFDLAVVESEGMTERDQFVGTLRRHDARHNGSVEYRTFLGAVSTLAQR